VLGRLHSSDPTEPLETGSRAIIGGAVSLVLLIPLVYYIIVKRQRIIVDKPFLMMLLYFCTLLASSVLARDKGIALKGLTSFALEGLALYLLVVNVIRDFNTLRRVIWVVLLAGAFMASITIWQEVTMTTDNTYGGLAQRGGVFDTDATGVEKMVRTRAAGPVGEQNRYAQVLLVLVPLGVYLMVNAGTRASQITALVLTIIVLAGILLTFSRGGFVSLVAIVALMPALGLLRARHLLIPGLAAILAVPVILPEYIVRIQSMARVPGLFSSHEERPDTSVSRRYAGNIATWEVFKQHPIIGVGPGHFAKYYSSAYVNRGGLAIQSRNFRGHNLYLEVMSEVGLIGLLAFLGIIGSIARRLYKLRRSVDVEGADLAKAFLLSILGYLLSAMFLHLAYPRYFFLLLALAASTARLVKLAPENRDRQPAQSFAAAAR